MKTSNFEFFRKVLYHVISGNLHGLTSIIEPFLFDNEYNFGQYECALTVIRLNLLFLETTPTNETVSPKKLQNSYAYDVLGDP